MSPMVCIGDVMKINGEGYWVTKVEPAWWWLIPNWLHVETDRWTRNILRPLLDLSTVDVGDGVN